MTRLRRHGRCVPTPDNKGRLWSGALSLIRYAIHSRVSTTKEGTMPDATDQRPPVAIGHVRFNVTDVGAASRWLAGVGLRTIVSDSDLAVLELRGGTHLVVRQVERPP